MPDSQYSALWAERRQELSKQYDNRRQLKREAVAEAKAAAATGITSTATLER